MSMASPIPPHLHASSSTSPQPTTPGASGQRSSPTSSPQRGSPRGTTSRIPVSTVDIETLLKTHHGDMRKALEAVIAERNSLHLQNAQLWNMIQHNRGHTSQHTHDIERLRSDRDRANAKLAAAGLETVGKRVVNSASAVGLGIKAEAPPIRRHNSDRDDIGREKREVRADTTPHKSSGQPPPAWSQAGNAAAGNGVESRREPAPLLSSTGQVTEAPSLSVGADGRAGQASSPVPLGPMIANSSGQGKPSIDKHASTPKPRPPQDPAPSQHSPRASIEAEQFSVDNAAMSQPRMTANLLPHTRLSIPNSSIHPNSLGRDVLYFTVSITVRAPNSQPVSWNVNKLFSAFIELDSSMRAHSGKRSKEWRAITSPLPDGKAWKDFAPSKIDQRKVALEAYLHSLLVAPINDKTDLCDFLSTDQVSVKTSSLRKEGYLTKKGKNFGGWKTRYFVVDGAVMDYFESRGGSQLGSITITNAQIGRQNRPSDSSDDRDFRHAFLIIETARKGGPNRHVLCAESDLERDHWIEVLVQHVEPKPSPQPVPPIPPSTGLARARSNSRKSSKDVVITASQPLSTMPSDSKFANVPSPSLINNMEMQRANQIPQAQSGRSLASTQSSTELHTPVSRIPASDSAQSRVVPVAEDHDSNVHRPITVISSPSPAWPSTMEPTPKAKKRQSHMSSKPQYTSAYLTKLSNEGLSAPPGQPGFQEKERERKAKSGRFWSNFGRTPERNSKPVFGVPLSDSIQIASVAGLPAPVFRCIEYLESKKAEEEEGIYRLSGSSAVIKGLKDRFDVEGDVKLLKVDEHWDPHAIAGLMKTYLRDLPTSLLTRELHPRFLAVMDFIDPLARVNELSRLVSDLPPPNYTLLRALTAHLILIVKHSHTNKMTLRNIGIVFSPTLGIPAGIFSELVSNFTRIFDDTILEEEDEEEVGPGEQCGLRVSTDQREDTIKRKRNSMLYQAAGADTMLGLTGRSLESGEEDSASELSTDDLQSSSEPSLLSSEHLGTTTPKADGGLNKVHDVTGRTGTGTAGMSQIRRGSGSPSPESGR